MIVQLRVVMSYFWPVCHRDSDHTSVHNDNDWTLSHIAHLTRCWCDYSKRCSASRSFCFSRDKTMLTGGQPYCVSASSRILTLLYWQEPFIVQSMITHAHSHFYFIFHKSSIAARWNWNRKRMKLTLDLENNLFTASTLHWTTIEQLKNIWIKSVLSFRWVSLPHSSVKRPISYVNKNAKLHARSKQLIARATSCIKELSSIFTNKARIL